MKIVEKNQNKRSKGMRVEIEWTRSYNKFSGRAPWIAKITSWPVGGKPVMAWGAYQGDEDGGSLEINAISGDIIRWGQKTSAVSRTVRKWGIVQSDGSICECTEAKAHSAWKANQENLENLTVENLLPEISDKILLAACRARGLRI